MSNKIEKPKAEFQFEWQVYGCCCFLTVFCACVVVAVIFRPLSFVTLFKIANVGRNGCFSNLFSVLPMLIDATLG